jgi:hypothetical protein
MSEIAAGLASITHAIAIVKALASTSQTLAKADMVGKLIDLQEALLAIQIRQGELEAENQRLSAELFDMKQQSNVAKTVEYHFDAYWVRKSAEELDGPFSAGHYDENNKLVRIEYYGKVRHGEGAERFLFKDRKFGTASMVPVQFVLQWKVGHLMPNLSDCILG